MKINTLLEITFYQKWPLPVQVILFIVCLVVGVFCLVKFSDWFVAAASAIAKKLKVSPLIIGLTVVAFGTSCPELAVSVSDSITTLIEGGNANVAIGNVVGSNICNLLLVLGFSVIFTPIVVKKSICKKEYPFLLGVTALLVIFGIFFGMGSVTGNYAIVRWEGIILTIGIFCYMAFLIINAKRHPEEADSDTQVEDMATWKAIILVIVGIAGIAIGGELVVFGAKNIAMSIGDAAHLNHDLVESLVGLTIVAVGTSLPELVTSVIAAKKGQNEIALGNVIGSNIFNILFVLGIAATVNPLTTGGQIVVDLLIMFGVTVVVFIMALRGKIQKRDGVILLCLYVGYLTYIVLRTIL